MDDDAWMQIGAAAAQVVGIGKGAAPDTGEESVPSAGAQAAGGQGRAHHGEGGAVIRVDFRTGRVTSRSRGTYSRMQETDCRRAIVILHPPVAPARLRR